MKSSVFTLCLALAACAVATATAAENKSTDLPVAGSAEVDALFAAWNKKDVPGAGVAVVHHGKIVYEKGFGSANLEYEIPIRPATVFHVASVSKQFTAMAVLLLAHDGKLSIDDDAHKYLPELPDYGQPVSIRHLLQHTSGIRDQWSTLGLAGWDLKDIITQDQILRLLFRQKELNFAPGDRMLYSNGGFTLLAEIVHRVSGQTFPEFCRTRIFEPLGMSRTHFHQQLEVIVPNRAYSYEPRASGFVHAPLNYANAGATSLFTTAGDLARWLDNLREIKVGTKDEIAELGKPGVLTSGKAIDYGLGIGTGTYRGLRTLSHGGADAGYRSFVLWFPEQEFGVAIASNHARFNAGALANQVADLYLAADFTEKKPGARSATARESIALDAAAFDKFTGAYAFDDAREFVLTYSREAGKFYAQATGQDRFEIFPESTSKFFYKVVDAQVTFVADPDGTVNRIVHHQGGRDQRGTRIVAKEPEAATSLTRFAGVYWSEELETRYTFAMKGDRLVARHLRHGEFPLTHVKGNRFSSRMWFMPTVEFLTDGTGEVTGAKLGGGRVLGIHFVRQGPAPATTSPIKPTTTEQ